MTYDFQADYTRLEHFLLQLPVIQLQSTISSIFFNK